MRLYLVYSFSQASPRWWELLSHRSILVSADDVAGRLGVALEQLRGLDVIVDSGGYRLISRGRLPHAEEVLRVQEVLVEEVGALPVALDHPLSSRSPSDGEVRAANEATLRSARLWQRRFGDMFILPLHARTERQLLEAYRLAREMLGGVWHVGLGSQALVSRTDPCRVARLALTLRKVHEGPVHVFGVGNTTLLLLAALDAADSADTAAPLMDARYGLARHPETLQMTVVAPRRLRGRRPRAMPGEIASRCSCPVCRRSPERLSEWGRRGVEARAVHNAHMLLRMMENPREALEKLAKRKCTRRILSEAASPTIKVSHPHSITADSLLKPAR